MSFGAEMEKSKDNGASNVSFMSRVFKILGFRGSPSKESPSITETLERMDNMEQRVERIEQVTMSWNLDELTEEQKKDMGLID